MSQKNITRIDIYLSVHYIRVHIWLYDNCVNKNIANERALLVVNQCNIIHTIYMFNSPLQGLKDYLIFTTRKGRHT